LVAAKADWSIDRGAYPPDFSHELALFLPQAGRHQAIYDLHAGSVKGGIANSAFKLFRIQSVHSRKPPDRASIAKKPFRRLLRDAGQRHEVLLGEFKDWRWIATGTTGARWVFGPQAH
jgi:hypothetical protein